MTKKIDTFNTAIEAAVNTSLQPKKIRKRDKKKMEQAFKEWWLMDGKFLCGSSHEKQVQDLFNVGFKAALEVYRPMPRRKRNDCSNIG